MDEELRQTIRNNVYSTLIEYGDIQDLKDYVQKVPFAWHLAELFSWWFDDTYYPEDDSFRSLFTAEELEAMAEFTALWRELENELPEDYVELLESPQWARIAAKGREVAELLPEHQMRGS